MSIIKKACFELNFLNLKSFPSNLFFVVASSLSILCLVLMQHFCSWHSFVKRCAHKYHIWKPSLLNVLMQLVCSWHSLVKRDSHKYHIWKVSLPHVLMQHVCSWHSFLVKEMATNITCLFRLWYWLYDDVFLFMTSLEYMQPDLNSLEHKQTLQYGFSPGWIISCLFKLERFWTPNLISFHLWRRTFWIPFWTILDHKLLRCQCQISVSVTVNFTSNDYTISANSSLNFRIYFDGSNFTKFIFMFFHVAFRTEWLITTWV
jgi:hypothetical protein